MNQLWEEYQTQLNMLAIHMPRSKNDKNLAHIREVIKQHKVIHPIIIDNESKLTDAFQNKYVPTYYLFDEKGLLRYQQTGERTQMLYRRIYRMLNHGK